MKVNRIIYFMMIVLLISGCKVSSFLQPDEQLYTDVEIRFEQKDKVEDIKELKSLLKEELYPKPAEKFLGIAYTKQWMYKNVTVPEGKTRGLKHWLKYKFGEKPILVSDVDQVLMNKINTKTMQDEGYFQSPSRSKNKIEGQKATIQYTIDNSTPSHIDSIYFPNTTSDIDNLIKEYRFLRTKEGERYKLENLSQDREDLAAYIRGKGYYDFDQKDLFYLIDTVGKGPDFDIYFKVRPPKDDSIHRRYYIGNVNVYVTDDNTIYPDSNQYESTTYKGIHIHKEFPFIADKTIYSNTLIEPNKRFSVDDFTYTSGRFINMEIFDYVNINYTKVSSNQLDVEIILNPSATQSFSAGVEANTSNRSFLGGALNASYSHNNVDLKADKLSLSGNFGTELQNNNGRTQFNIFNYGGEARYEVPRLFFFLDAGKLPSEQAPKTFAQLNFDHQQWLDYYTLNSVDLSYGYDWTNASRFHHDIKALSLNVVDVRTTTDEFQETLDENPLLATSFQDQLILGSQYRFSFDTRKRPDQKSYFHFNNFFDIAGNTAWLVSRAASQPSKQRDEIFGVPYAQYLRDEIEIRFYYKINNQQTFVTRLETGVGYAYGNSDILPFTKKFFVGGPNTIRGFGFRSLGPGRYNYTEGNNRINPIQQSGDVRILLNAEYRFPIISIFKGAFFIDAGNIWLLEEDPDRPNSEFGWNTFTDQMALASGVGLRLDLGFFVLRGDLGIPLYKPYEAEGRSWITDYTEQGFSEWRKTNSVLNIAIGYPF